MHYHHGTRQTDRGYITDLLDCVHTISGDVDQCDACWEDLPDDEQPRNPFGARRRRRLPYVATIDMNVAIDDCVVCKYLTRRRIGKAA